MLWAQISTSPTQSCSIKTAEGFAFSLTHIQRSSADNTSFSSLIILKTKGENSFKTKFGTSLVAQT